MATDCPTCPHCGHRWEEWWRDDAVCIEDFATSSLTCGACNESYKVTARLRVTFTADRPPG